MLGHARRQQALAHLVAQFLFGFFLVGLFLGGFLGLLDMPAGHGFFVGLLAGCGGLFGGLLLFELCEGVFFDDAVALGFLLLGLPDY